MTPPISVDGTDITGATIDGTEVQEITVDGQTVFSAGPSLPVAYSNLAAWYPFDSATYGGSNADDVTAILGGSGDDTAYDGTVNGATYQSSGGVTDINAGANSGAFDFTPDDRINSMSLTNFDGSPGNDFTITGWIFPQFIGDFEVAISVPSAWELGVRVSDALHFGTFGFNIGDSVKIPTNAWSHFAVYWDPGTEILTYIDGDLELTSSTTDTSSSANDLQFGGKPNNSGSFDGLLEDVRFYNTELTLSQVSEIYDNTKPLTS